jgi:hypothetical protein
MDFFMAVDFGKERAPESSTAYVWHALLMKKST